MNVLCCPEQLFRITIAYLTLHTVLSRYYDVCEMLLITIPNLSSKHYQIIEIYAGYIDSLDILIHFPYPNSIVITSLLYTYV